jgi:hypothetical protein
MRKKVLLDCLTSDSNSKNGGSSYGTGNGNGNGAHTDYHFNSSSFNETLVDALLL